MSEWLRTGAYAVSREREHGGVIRLKRAILDQVDIDQTGQPSASNSEHVAVIKGHTSRLGKSESYARIAAERSRERLQFIQDNHKRKN